MSGLKPRIQVAEGIHLVGPAEELRGALLPVLMGAPAVSGEGEGLTDAEDSGTLCAPGSVARAPRGTLLLRSPRRLFSQNRGKKASPALNPFIQHG